MDKNPSTIMTSIERGDDQEIRNRLIVVTRRHYPTTNQDGCPSGDPDNTYKEIYTLTPDKKIIKTEIERDEIKDHQINRKPASEITGDGLESFRSGT